MTDSAEKTPVISIVDDDASIRSAMVDLVMSHGFEVHSFDSAEQFLSSSERRETSCIVSDVQMPGTSGIELKNHLRAQNDHTPVIFVTAFPQPAIRKQAIDAGAICFLAKPFDGATLMGCIAEALGGGAGGGHSHC
jgi:FixJ family two-component response regulator